jgi:hypothetical protein
MTNQSVPDQSTGPAAESALPKLAFVGAEGGTADGGVCVDGVCTIPTSAPALM